jgi:acetyl coenzyme A synthetase (ADP forming)-like protein
MQKFEGDVVLRDGSLVRVRKTTTEDAGPLLEFLKSLSTKTISMRFLGKTSNKEELVARLLPSHHEFGLLAEREGKVVAEADYEVSSTSAAEVGVVVADTYQRKGLGAILLGQLSQAASEAGITIFRATAPAEAHYALNFVKSLGHPEVIGTVPGFVSVTFPTSISAAGVLAFERREARSAVAAVAKFLKPRSIAIIGASRERDTIGGALFRNILDGGFGGPVYPVNREAPVVQSVAAYKSVLECPDPVDLAFVVVPAKYVASTAKECARKGVKAMVVISSGFSEVGGEGVALQKELVAICSESGMRLIGPNCMGIVNTEPGVSLNGQFAPVSPRRGKIGFVSQSGALGYAIIDHANNLGLGMSSFVSVGNKADISSNDLIQYWEEDKNTDLILIHIESFGNPRKFARLATRIARKKPIVIVKSGRSAAGFRATQSHTGALVAASDVTVDALFRQSGVVRTDSLEEMFEVAAVLATQPVPRGENVAIITNAGGPGILAADACESLGLKVPEFTESTKNSLRGFLLPIAGTKNPVDMTSVATADDYARAIEAVSRDTNVDALIVIFIPPIAVKTEDVARAILRAAGSLERRVPLITTFMAAKGVTGQLSGKETSIPAYPFPESAARALSRAAQYGRWLAAPRGKRVEFKGTRKLEAAAIVSRALAEKRGWLDPAETDALLDCYGIPRPRGVNVASPVQAGKAARGFKGNVVLKAVAPELIHKSDVGGVMVGLSKGEVEIAAGKMTRRLARRGIRNPRFLVQEMVSEAVEMFVGVTNDASFGPLLACGAGGALVELIRDVAVRLTPLTDLDARQMVRSLRTFPLLEGYRGGPARDVGALEEILLRLSELVEDLPEVDELDLNPVMVHSAGKGAVVVDARVHVAETAPELPLGAKK